MINCKGYWTHNSDASEFDCEYENAGAITCDSCIINGGVFSPQTGKIFRGNRKKYIQQARLRDLNHERKIMKAPPIELFVVKHYADDEYPTIKGNGFDGMILGRDRQEAEIFVEFVNKLINYLNGGYDE